MPFTSDQDIPRDIQLRLARAAAKLQFKYPMVQHDDITELMMDTIQIFDDYVHRTIEERRSK